jgi:DNA-binding MarR family transcriptional regulator
MHFGEAHGPSRHDQIFRLQPTFSTATARADDLSKAPKVKIGKSKVRRRRLDERVGYRFSIITKRLNQALAGTHSKKLGISINNWKIMSVIGFFGPLSATALGAHTGLDSDKVTRAVDTLVWRGYVIRKTDERDRRRVLLTLSPNGRRVHDRIELVASALEAEFLSVLTTEEYRSFLAALTKLHRHSDVMFGSTGRADGSLRDRPGASGQGGRMKSQARTRQSAGGQSRRVYRRNATKRAALMHTGSR